MDIIAYLQAQISEKTREVEEVQGSLNTMKDLMKEFDSIVKFDANNINDAKYIRHNKYIDQAFCLHLTGLSQKLGSLIEMLTVLQTYLLDQVSKQMVCKSITMN